MIPLSVLDLVADRRRQRRHAVAEEHARPRPPCRARSAIIATGWPSITTCRGIASAATSVVIGHVAAGTSTIRVGAGGIMLPNHAPLVIAEQFGTLAALHPGRIDLGLGRAPGTDMATARALRRNLEAGVDSFPQDVVELLGYFAPAAEGQRVRAVPGEGQDVKVWILGSSTYGAQLAAMLGLPYAFASHFAPAELEHALDIYRDAVPAVGASRQALCDARASTCSRRRPTRRRGCCSARCSRPSSICAPGGRDNCRRRSRVTSRRSIPAARAMLAQALSAAVVGSPETVKRGIDAFVRRTGADELMVTAQIFDHAARVRSFEILAECSRGVCRRRRREVGYWLDRSCRLALP